MHVENLVWHVTQYEGVQSQVWLRAQGAQTAIDVVALR